MRSNRNSHLHITATQRTLLASICLVGFISGCGKPSAESSLAAAKAHIEARNCGAAIVELKNVLQAGESAEGHFYLGLCATEMSDWATSERHLRRALELKTPMQRVAPFLARTLAGVGDSRKLLAELGPVVIEDVRDRAVVKTLLGEAHLGLRQWPEAELAFKTAVDAESTNARARIGLARVHLANNRVKEAEGITDEVLATTPTQEHAVGLKADILIGTGRTTEAKGLLTKLVNADPKNIQANIGLISIALGESNLSAAETLAKDFRKHVPKDLRAPYMEALVAFRKSDFTRAKELVTSVLNVAPDHGPSLLLSGATAYSTGNLSTAEDTLKKVVYAFPDSRYARNLLVATLLRKGQPVRAEEALAPALRASPNDPVLLRTAGEVAFANNRFEDAVRYYESAQKADKGQADAANQTRLAQFRLSVGDETRALSELETASTRSATDYQADLSLVATHLKRKDYTKALTALAALEKKQPNNPLTYALKGSILVARGDFSGARTQLERALAIQPTYLAAARILAGMDVSESKIDAGQRRIEAVIALEPNNDSAVLALAEIQARAKLPAKTIVQTIERAIKANPGSSAPWIALTRQHAQSHDAQAAMTAAQKGGELFPNDPKMLDALGLAQMAAGDAPRAASTFEKLVKLMPDSPQALVRLASAQYAAKQVDAPIQALTKALTLQPDLLEAKQALVAAQVAAGRGSDAMRETKSLQKSKPREGAGFTLEGDVHMAQKRFAEAATAYQESLNRQRDPLVAVKLHQAYLATGNASAATSFAEKWGRENPSDSIVPFHLANESMQKRDFKDAATRFKKLLERQPNDPSLLNNLAWVLSESKDPSALSYAKRAYEVAPTSAEVQDTYGWLLVAAGDAAKAVPILEAATATRSDVAEIRMHYAKALLAVKDSAGARRELTRLSQDTASPAIAEEAKTLLRNL